MIKSIAPAQRHPTNRLTLAEFHHYWAESHGPLFANTKGLHRYVQHLSLPNAFGCYPEPTYDGVSMFWTDDDFDPFNLADAADETVSVLQEAVLEDDRQLFDRVDSWPRHLKGAVVFAKERVIVEGESTPEMVKAIFVVGKLPGLNLNEFFDRWEHHHGPLAARLPGLRRYVQNHAILEYYATGRQTQDGWSELWFDDLTSLHRASASPEWRSLREDGAKLFAQPVGVSIAHERVQKDWNWIYNDWGVGTLSVDEIRRRLSADGYLELAADVNAPAKIKGAAARQALALWSCEHLVTIDESRIDARPTR